MSAISIEAASYLSWIKELIPSVQFYGTLTLCPVGLAFNLLQIAIFSRKKFHSTTMGFYNIVSEGIETNVFGINCLI